METADRLSAAYEGFMSALEGAAIEPDLNQRALDAYNAYAALLADAAKEPAAAEANDAFEAYRAVISSGFRGPEAGNQIRAAYKNYLAEVRAAWAETDPTVLTPADLATIGQSLAYLAWLVETGLDGAEAESEETGDDAIANEQGSSLWGPTSLLSDTSRPEGQM
jgi:hypothetical protein